MKKIISIFGVVCLMFSACQSLDVPPLNIITDDDLLTNEIGLKTYMANVYRNLPIEDFYYRPGNGFGRDWQQFYALGGICGELLGPFWGNSNENGFGYWDNAYTWIRNINHLIEVLPATAQGMIPEQSYNHYLGEAYFCRAFIYFALVKRYGGVPLIDREQNYPEQSLEELQLPRSKEADCWRFIGEDLDEAARLMGETSERGRANRYTALAIKSRAMLFAGTIAKYGADNFVEGEARDQGIVGIPASEAQGFFQQAYDAAKAVEGHVSLYKKRFSDSYDDKIANYVELFLDKDSPENLLIREYSLSSNTAHSWDATLTCRYMTADGLSRAYPNYELMRLFDGGNINVVDDDGYPIRFERRGDIRSGVEPRLRAIVYFPDDELRGLTFDIQRGIYDHFDRKAADEVVTSVNDRRGLELASGSNIVYSKDPNMRVIGLCGVNTSPDGDNTRSGFYMRKYIDYNKPKDDCGLYRSTTHWIAVRYAEVLLNRAEAAFELGMKDDAANCIDEIRERAGAKLVDRAVFNNDPTENGVIVENNGRDIIRNERRKELAFENHYWWDLRRWRIADKMMDNTIYNALYPYYIYDERKYIFLDEEQAYTNNRFTFNKRFYYEGLPGGELNKNPNLYPNNPNH
ncbi:MAG: RagB/SusD family nutrient uptake outer membrane protein [Tannerella sp.]|nr:RagB/SusD family nutrient uptake outer membrane protein [Tannerella sp.]